MLFEGQYQTHPICPRQLTLPEFDFEAKVRAHVEAFEVRIHGGIYYIQAPKHDEEERRIIDIPSEFIAVGAYCVRVKVFESGVYFLVVR
jgi:hypothetical protein